MLPEPDRLRCPSGCEIRIVRGVPRFVESSHYAAGFGLQWKHFSKTQLDSDTGTTISKDRLTRCVGGSLEILKDKSVLEVGCGSGRFTEVMLAAGAQVFACDLSEAVEANYENCSGAENYFVCQADLRQLPVEPHSFDVVVCLGVIQHTPSPEETIGKLSSYLKPSGLLVIDHYAPGYSQNFLQRNLRRVLIRLPASVAKPLALALARCLLPAHRLSWTNGRGSGRYRRFLLQHSPVVDYYDAYRELGTVRLSQWSVLDTHDTLTDYYKHLRTAEQIRESLRSCGLVDIEVSYGGNGVEARAKMPVSGRRET
jgi:SAM-dependent methyltransferase